MEDVQAKLDMLGSIIDLQDALSKCVAAGVNLDELKKFTARWIEIERKVRQSPLQEAPLP